MEKSESLHGEDIEFASSISSSDSVVSSLSKSEDTKIEDANSSSDGSSNISSGASTSSSSSSSSSSGEIPSIMIDEAVIPMTVDLTTITTTTNDMSNIREACIGRRNKSLSWGFTSVIGRRKEMEDAVAVIPGFMSRTCDHVGGCTAPGSKFSTGISPVHFFAVYDGHGGSQVAKFCAERMHEVVAEEWERGEIVADGWRRRWEVAFSTGFERTDNEVSEESVAPEIVGSTAVAVALSGCQIITSNCGDSRAILCRGNQTIQLSLDHKPDREDELARIEGGGGKVINWNGARVFGVLAMSRSIGDRYLRPWIIPVPEITFTTRAEDDECLIVASDGLWDVMTNDEVGEIACHLFKRLRRASMADETSLAPAQAVADHLTDIASKKNSSDNISIIVVDLKIRRKRIIKQAK